MQPGRLDLRLGASTLFATTSHLAECPDLGPACRSATPPQPYNHHVDLFMTEASLDASYGLTPWLAAEARFTMRLVDVSPSYTERDGSPKTVVDDIHHHDETLVGPSDPWLVLRVGAARGKLVTAARLGLSLPLGRTEPDPYALGEEGKWHEHIQFGSGTFVPIVGLGASYAGDPVEVSLTALAQMSLYDNAEGFRAPSRMVASLRATVPVAGGALRPYLQLDLPHETDERWGGAPGLEGSNERTEILAGGGVGWRFSGEWQVDVGFRARVAELTDAAAFDYPGLLQLGLSTAFDVGGGP